MYASSLKNEDWVSVSISSLESARSSLKRIDACISQLITLEPKEKDERKMDPEVKERFMTDEYKNALVHLLIDTYKELNDEEKVIVGVAGKVW